jgi:predicted dienelactone hydrolase
MCGSPATTFSLRPTVYRPGTTQGDAPCVVMAAGFLGTRDDGLPGYAEALRDAGFVIAFFRPPTPR